MKLRGYLLDKLPYFLLLTVAGVLSYVLLIGTGTSRDAALFAVLLYSLMALIALAVDFVAEIHVLPRHGSLAGTEPLSKRAPEPD